MTAEPDPTRTPEQPPEGTLVGQTLGGYEITAELARGGMGIVFRARQMQLDRHVALKVISSSGGRSVARERFLREARAAARLLHPGIVPIHELGHDKGLDFYTMDLVSGQTLAAVMKGGCRLEVALRWMAEVCDAVHYAHLNGVLHRDLKPSNIMVDQAGRALITDFGLARDLSQDRLTQSGDLMGTPFYMAPEQLGAEKGEMDARTDVYALGVILYELVTGGKLPFRASTPAELLYMIISAPPRPLEEAVDRDMITVIERAMARRRADRYQTAKALGEELRRVTLGRPILARPRSGLERLADLMRQHRLVTALLLLMFFGAVAFGTYAAVMAKLYSEQTRLAQDGRRVAEAKTQEAEDALARERELRAELEAASRANRAREWVGQARELYRAQADIEKVLILLKRADRQAPGLTASIRLRGRIALDQRKWDAARPLLESALAQAPNDYLSHFLLYRWHSERSGRETLRAAWHASEAGNYATNSGIGWWARAWRLHHLAGTVEPQRTQRLRQALASVQKALIRNPELLLARALRAFIYADLGQFDRGLADMNQVLAVRRYPVDLANRAIMLSKMRRYGDALADIELALSGEPSRAKYHLIRADIHKDCGRLDLALASYTRAGRLDPTDPRAPNGRGQILNLQRKPDEAYDAFSRAIEIDPKYYKGYNNRGATLRRLGRPADALLDFRASVALNPRNAKTYLNRSNVYSDLGRFPEAMADLDTALRIDPTYAKAYFNRATLLRIGKKYEKALAAYRQAIRHADGWIGPQLGYATLLADVGRHKEAFAAFDQVLRAAPRSVTAYLNRGVLHSVVGQYREAKRDWETALGLDPTPAQRRSLQARLKAVAQKLRNQ